MENDVEMINPKKISPSLTFRVLVGQPMVFGSLMLKVGVPHLALLISKVSQGLCTLLHVTELELIVVSITSAPPVGRTTT